MSMLSICMIVKNEEELIEAALESVKSVADEIIIIDTGSSDKSREICLNYTDKVYSVRWNKDFSSMRNKGLKRASCDWILYLDADERLKIRDKVYLQNLLKEADCDLYSLKVIHLTDTEEEENQYDVSWQNRLFRRDKEYSFDGCIHEKIVDRNGWVPQAVKAENCIEILHYGYIKKERKKRGKRNLSVCKKAKEQEKVNPLLDYDTAIELYRLGNTAEALELVNRSIKDLQAENAIPPAGYYRLKYEINYNTGQLTDSCEELDLAISQYSDFVDLHFYRGIALMQLKRFRDAIKEFTYCILLGEDNEAYLIRNGSGSFLAYYYMGKAYYEMGETETACESYKQALLYNKDLIL